MSTEGEVLVGWEAEREGGSGVGSIRALRILRGARSADQGPRAKNAKTVEIWLLSCFCFENF